MAAIRKAKIKTEQSYIVDEKRNMEGGCRNRIPGVDREGPTSTKYFTFDFKLGERFTSRRRTVEQKVVE